MSNCCFPQDPLSIHPSWSSHPHAASLHLQTNQNCQQLSCDELNPRLCSTPSPALPSQLCRIGRFCAAAGRKRHRYVEAAAHHGPLHLLHRPQWVGRPTPACSRPGTVSIPSVHLMFWLFTFLFFPFRLSSHEDRLWKHGGEDGVQREVCQPGVFQLQATGQPGAADHQTEQRGRFLFQ